MGAATKLQRTPIGHKLIGAGAATGQFQNACIGVHHPGTLVVHGDVDGSLGCTGAFGKRPVIVEYPGAATKNCPIRIAHVDIKGGAGDVIEDSAIGRRDLHCGCIVDRTAVVDGPRVQIF